MDVVQVGGMFVGVDYALTCDAALDTKVGKAQLMISAISKGPSPDRSFITRMRVTFLCEAMHSKDHNCLRKFLCKWIQAALILGAAVRHLLRAS